MRRELFRANKDFKSHFELVNRVNGGTLPIVAQMHHEVSSSNIKYILGFEITKPFPIKLWGVDLAGNLHHTQPKQSWFPS